MSAPRKEKTIKSITIKEIKVKDAIEMLGSDVGLDSLLGIIAGRAKDIHALLLKCTDASPEDLDALSYSDYMPLTKALLEVNADFLASVQTRIDQIVDAGLAIKTQIETIKGKMNAGSTP